MYEVLRTDTFLEELKRFKRNKQLLVELDKKIQRLKEDPHNVGGNLSRSLKGHKSTRLAKKFRLVFRIDEHSRKIYLEAIDHREYIYE